MKFLVSCGCILYFSLSGLAMAKCRKHTPAEIVKQSGFIVSGKVIKSNFDGKKTDLTQIGKRHRFTVKVLTYLKGADHHTQLFFDYRFMMSKPPVKLFSVGTSYLFAVTKIDDKGQATLLGTMCGKSGLDVSQIGTVSLSILKSHK